MNIIQFILISLFVICSVMLIYTMNALNRNQKVFKMRMYILDLIKKNSKFGKEYIQMTNYYESISYDEMLNKFWKPVDSFYDMTRFEIK